MAARVCSKDNSEPKPSYRRRHSFATSWKRLNVIDEELLVKQHGKSLACVVHTVLTTISSPSIIEVHTTYRVMKIVLFYATEDWWSIAVSVEFFSQSGSQTVSVDLTIIYRSPLRMFQNFYLVGTYARANRLHVYTESWITCIIKLVRIFWDLSTRWYRGVLARSVRSG